MFFLFLENCISRTAQNLFMSVTNQYQLYQANNMPLAWFQRSLEGIKTRPERIQMTQEHVLAEEDEATRRRETYRDNKDRNRRKQASKAKKQENKAEPGTLPHDLPSSSYSRRQRYQVSVPPLSRPPSVNKSTKTKQTTRIM